ncbi:hypothetical protein LTS08_005510 [Lithohypha guttulata]|uniref:GID complex catalytic subunit 2 n=1 Tax=Lithohypha guttulata TaxID=1690604 RepID=A0AAN7T1K6_9EURO|nr:hypothetical protein LTR05_004311 [Lithohypha guttulata]KAK5099795.1 hypothetical protein LTS08_005510 [Lithohypha guttulata]
MEAVQREHEKVWEGCRKAKTIDATQSIIDQLRKARESIASDPASAQITLVKLQAPVKAAFDDMTASLKTTRGGQNNYQKALDKLFRDKPLPSNEIDALSQQSNLINRAVYLHLLREGLFDVASTMQDEASRRATVQRDLQQSNGLDISIEDPIGMDQGLPDGMLDKFQSMHRILDELRLNHNLQPAMEWAQTNSADLQDRGSNLGFELCRLQYARILFEDSQNGFLSMSSMVKAMEYAQSAFQPFQTNYLHEIQELMGAIAFFSNLNQSPYHARLNTTVAWDEVASSFTREFCALLELSADSPLYITSTAGAIALPPLLKLQAIQKQKNASWTSANELPVETPLPSNYQFHSIFVCPVSKEQSTDQNPPMMMPCGHVICQDSLTRLAKGSKFKCPYCPSESSPTQATRIIL